MKTTLGIATIALFFAAAHPIATAAAMPQASANAPAGQKSQNTTNTWDGKWQGTTVSGQTLVLEIKMQGQRMTGKLTVGKQSASIIAGKVVDQGFAISTGPIDGHKVDGTGRHLGDAIELSIDGVKEPLRLTRV